MSNIIILGITSLLTDISSEMVYATLVGIGLLPASLLTGWLWTFFGPKTAFITGGCLGLTAAAAMGTVLGRQKDSCV
ncbi:MAG: hypothetical protein EHM85_18275 [Desulfobacteraceae bacterium]|nr:MAG: hypothetical protein EHM85_18275 [Desulfobacteraceae bacterium]